MIDRVHTRAALNVAELVEAGDIADISVGIPVFSWKIFFPASDDCQIRAIHGKKLVCRPRFGKGFLSTNCPLLLAEQLLCKVPYVFKPFEHLHFDIKVFYRTNKRCQVVGGTNQPFQLPIQPP